MKIEALLLSWTPDPLDLVARLYWQAKFSRSSAPERFAEFYDYPNEALTTRLLLEGWCPLLEFPQFVWQLRVPRSLHAQITRHRHVSFFSQSHQLHEPDSFAETDSGDVGYWPIPGLSPRDRTIELHAMQCSQFYYQQLRTRGVLPALARGVLPLHIGLDLYAAMSLRSMFQMAVNRRCHIFQGTLWNPLLDSMADQLEALVAPEFDRLMRLQPCDVTGRCLSQLEQELRDKGVDPHPTCPRWRELEMTNGMSSCCGQGCSGCLAHSREKGKAVVRETYACRKGPDHGDDAKCWQTQLWQTQLF